MKYANEVIFLAFTLVLSGIFLSSLPYVGRRTSSNANNYWLIALVLNIVAFLLFASASSIGLVLLTFANTLFFASYFFLFIFFRALNSKPVEKIVTLSPLLFIAFGAVLECLRQFGVFQDRVLFVISFLIFCLIGILYELFQVRKRESYIQIEFLIFTFCTEIVLGVVRVWVLLENTGNSPQSIYTEPFLTTIIRWFGVSLSVLSYISINGFLTEKLAQSNAANLEDSKRVTNLLIERDSMIALLLKANKSSSTEALSASIAHELNQPLSASLLNIQFLKMLHESGKLKPELVGQIVGQLEKDAKRSGEVIQSLRSIFIKDDAVQEAIHVHEVIENALAIYKSDLLSKNIEIQTDFNKDLVIFCHKGQLLQLLLNLINNAIQVLNSSDSANKFISFHGYHQDEQYLLEIRDSGPGVPKEKQAHLFELLSSDKSNGMGIGLWLCAYIMRNAGGKITYQDALGGGATFTLSFPMTREDM